MVPELVGEIQDIDRKKGLIEEITIRDESKKHKLKPEQISHMYLPPSGFSSFVKQLCLSHGCQQLGQ